MILTNQVDHELYMLNGGRAKVLAGIQKNEKDGRGHDNPYAQAVYRRFVLPLADLIREYCKPQKRGVLASAKALLRAQDPLVCAFITVRTCLSLTDSPAMVGVARDLGGKIYGEELLRSFEDINPQLYFTLVNDLERRLTKSERHKLRVFKHSANKAGMSLPQWSAEERIGIGTLLLGLARDLGLVIISTDVMKVVSITPDIAKLMESVTGFVAGMAPGILPCIEPPKPWLSPSDGGFHSEQMRRVIPCCFRNRSFVDDEDVPPMVLAALNRVQRDAWEINEDVFKIADEVREYFDVGEALSQAEVPRPSEPEWLAEGMKKEDMSPEQLQEFRDWCGLMREWHTESKQRGRRWGRYYEAMRVARMMRDRPIWFVYQMDYRGRFYTMTRGVNPQGSDLQKALLRAHGGAPLVGDEAVYWFKIAGATRWGFDKAPLDDMARWADDRHELILAVAADPISRRDWAEADCPFQFLAWCYEYAAWTAAEARGEVFITRLPLGQDGSCNGLQHFSAMLRDEVGGRATNLVPSDRKQDLYQLVADRTVQIIASEEGGDERLYHARWQAHPIARGLVKRSVMTLPYGSTRFSCADFILSDYLGTNAAPEFAKPEYGGAANWLSHRVWAAIGDVVVKAREAMEWLQRAADELMDAGAQDIVWQSPSGLMVRQVYPKQEIVRIKTRLLGGAEIRLQARLAKGDVPDKRRHRNGIAPNMIHSCDAAHMHFLINAAEQAGLGHLAFIHDDYGALAPDVPVLHRLIRSTFVSMYETNEPLEAFAERYGVQDARPDKGTLDITQVNESRHFFC